MVSDMPRFSSTGVRVLPTSRSSGKFWALRAPICMTSIPLSRKSWTSRGSMTSVTTGMSSSADASRRMSRPFSPMPWYEYGLVRGLYAPPRSIVAPARFTARAMSIRPLPSTEHGPAMTWKLPLPTSTPWPQSTTVSSGWNLRFAFLNGSETRRTWSMMSIDSRRNGSIWVVSPMMPTMVSFSPFETFVLKPRSSIHLTKWLSCSGVAESLTIAIMCIPFVRRRMRAGAVAFHTQSMLAHGIRYVSRRYSKRYEKRTPEGVPRHAMVTPVGLEPTTFRSGGERSDPLSYGAGKRCYYKFGGMSCGECGRVLKSGRLRELA